MITTRYDNYNKDHQYNTFNGLSDIPYKILSILIENNEIIFKILKYEDENPLEHDNLTIDEKIDLIYRSGQENPNGDEEDTGKRIFLIPKSTNGTVTQQSQLKINLSSIIPKDQTRALCTYAIEIISSLDIDLLDEGRCTRTGILCEEILKTLNGCRFDGIDGDLFFNNEMSRYDMLKHDVENNRNYHGYTIYMSCWISIPKSR